MKPAVHEVPNVPGKPFRLCAACARRLQLRSLRPLEWFRLAALHGWTSYLLHDDFYDDDGSATAPESPVDEPERFPYPHPDDWGTSVALALDVAYTKWAVPDALLTILRANPEATFDGIRRTLTTRSNPVFEARAHEIVAQCVGPLAEHWIREKWAAPNPETVLSLSQASAACLPGSEGVVHVVSFLTSLPQELRLEHVACLSWFRDPQALDALEALVRSPVTEDWGRVAASCGVDWARAQRWLEVGRPLSLVALDALRFCIRYDTELLRMTQPRLTGAVDSALVQQHLTRYVERDSVPRVKTAVAYLLANLQTLTTGCSRQTQT